jgi:hypothetical protein
MVVLRLVCFVVFVALSRTMRAVFVYFRPLLYVFLIIWLTYFVYDVANSLVANYGTLLVKLVVFAIGGPLIYRWLNERQETHRAERQKREEQEKPIYLLKDER